MVPPPSERVTGLTAKADDRQVNLTWDPMAGAAGYNVYANAQRTVQTPMTGVLIRNLTNGVTYMFEVAAFNTGGEGPRSTAARVVPREARRGWFAPGPSRR